MTAAAAPTLVALKRPPSDLARRLREMADAADAGELVEIVAVYVEGGEYRFLRGASLLNSIAMSAMLHEQALRDMRE